MIGGEGSDWKEQGREGSGSVMGEEKGEAPDLAVAPFTSSSTSEQVGPHGRSFRRPTLEIELESLDLR